MKRRHPSKFRGLKVWSDIVLKKKIRGNVQLGRRKRKENRILSEWYIGR